MEALKRILT